MSAFSSKLPDAIQVAGLWLGIAMILYGLAAAAYHCWKHKDKKKPLKLITPKIIVGQGSPYEKTNPIPNDRINRTISIGVISDRNISNCNLYVDYTKPNGIIDPIILDKNFALLENQERYIEIAFYREAIQAGVKGDDHMYFPMIQTGFFSYEYMPSIDKKHIVILRLEIHENIVVKENCYLWVENGKLKLEKV